MAKLLAIHEELMDYSGLMTLGSEEERETDRRRYLQALWEMTMILSQLLRPF